MILESGSFTVKCKGPFPWLQLWIQERGKGRSIANVKRSWLWLTSQNSRKDISCRRLAHLDLQIIYILFSAISVGTGLSRAGDKSPLGYVLSEVMDGYIKMEEWYLQKAVYCFTFHSREDWNFVNPRWLFLPLLFSEI